MSHRDYNPFSPAAREDPYPYYAALRREAPLHQVEPLGVWAVSRYADVVFVLSNPHLFSSSVMSKSDTVLLGSDPPFHTRNRKIVSRAFTPQRIASLEPRIREIADGLIAGIISRGECDLASDFSDPLPVHVIAEMLGIAPERRDDLKRWSQAAVTSTTGRPSPAQWREIAQDVEEFRDFFERVIAERRRNPRDDLLSALTRAEDAEEVFTPEQVLSLCMFLLIAGSETTTNLIGNAVLALLRHPEALAQVCQDLALVPPLVEEALRYESPGQFVYRRAAQNVALAGGEIPAGAVVIGLLGSANRDDRQFPDPDRFDLTRRPQGHVAFGLGPHFCLGASLARLEAKIALQGLLSQLRNLRLKEDGVTLVDSAQLRGPKRLPLAFDPA